MTSAPVQPLLERPDGAEADAAEDSGRRGRPGRRDSRWFLRRRRTDATDEFGDRGVLSAFDRRRGSVRGSLSLVHVFLFIGLVVAGLGPLLWLGRISYGEMARRVALVKSTDLSVSYMGYACTS